MFQRFMSLSSFLELLNKSKTFTLAFVFAFGVSACADMDSIYSEVADDAVAQYNMTKRHGDLMDICVHAMLVSAAYLQAQDEANYKKWKEQERRDCKAAEDKLMNQFQF